jgi:DNA-binding GntR family transcriptional regulator
MERSVDRKVRRSAKTLSRSLIGSETTGSPTKNAKSSLYEALKRRILTLELTPDHDLDEAELSEEYGISRTPVRDVLRRLAGEGYVYIRENRGARVIPMNLATLRDFFQVAPVVYEAIGRLAVQNFKPAQLAELELCQDRFRSAMNAGESETLSLHNNRFHSIIGDMAGSVFLRPSLEKLLIDHARIGHTFFNPIDDRMRINLLTACAHHDQFIEAIAKRDEDTMTRLVFEHWELSRRNMEIYVAPKELENEAVKRLAKPRAKRAA